MNKEEYLRQAKDHCFFIGVNDSGAEFCRANSVYGIAGMHCIQNDLGFKPNATFITTPDMTITRNTGRWKSGFGYGGKMSWGNGDNDLIILNVKPNACGMLVGGLDQMPDVESVIKKMHRMGSSSMLMDGINIEWDYYKSNHFIDIFEVKNVAKTNVDLPPYAFVIHGSAGEFTRDNESGFGLYLEKSKLLSDMAEKITTPFGDYQILTGNRADEYLTKFKEAENFSIKKRKLAADLLFDSFTEIANVTHQGLINKNEIILGCHHVKDQSNLYPLMLRGDLPAYLVHGKQNLLPEKIELLGFEKRARNLSVYDRLINANIIPHGGGYLLPDILTVNRIIEIDGVRYFEAEMQNDRGKKYITEVRDLPYEYRGRNVVLRSLEVELIDIVAKLIPRCVLKI